MARVFRTLVVAGVSAVVMTTMAPTAAQAQAWGDVAFVNVSFGGQTNARSVTARGSQPLYDEQATWESTLGVNGGGLFDIAVGRRIGSEGLWSNLAVGLGYSSYSDETSATVVASIPDTLFFDRPHIDSATLSGLDHRERGVHLTAYWRLGLPVTPVRVVVFAGPSFYSLRKDLPGDIGVAPGGVELTAVGSQRVSESGVGGHIGFDFQYPLMSTTSSADSLAVGLFLRYAGGSVDVPAVDGGSVDVGGFNYGIGIRAGF